MKDRLKVLVVDDDPSLRALYKQVLSGTYQVEIAEDGYRAEALLEQTRPDVVVLDMAMPGKSGLAVLKDLREDRRTKNTPVVVVSAVDPENELWAGQDWGWDRYLQKPLSMEDLMSSLEDVLRRRKSPKKSTPRKSTPRKSTPRKSAPSKAAAARSSARAPATKKARRKP
ncbi:MAG: response regulator [Actinomycetota bacterium]